MRTIDEIKNKIDSLLALLESERDIEKHENICCQIDALLWVIEDESGAPLIDEQVEQ